METTVLFISGAEIFIILIVVLLLFGANKLPEIARGLGKGYQEFKKATNDIRSEFNEHTRDIKQEVNNLKDDLENYNEFDSNEDPLKNTDQDKSGKDEKTSSGDSEENDTPYKE
ncbi:MAG: twin-arginine translocase TatA/TatE family subunit [Bacteroidales bacterium]